MNRILEITDLTFSYPSKDVFQSLSLSMNKGDVICLMGPNGCGKTTLIDNVMSIHTPANGQIQLLGKSLEEYSRKNLARYIAYVPQLHQVVFPYTVEQVVLMGRTAHVGQFGSPGNNDLERCFEAMKLVGVSHMAQKPYSQLSGGEVKLVLLARALCQQTPLIVMDEPTANLDFKNEMIFLETVVHLNQKDDLSILMATHSPEHAFYFQSKGLRVHAVMMHEGRIFAQGKPEEVITEENIRQVYGVRSRIHAHEGDQGTNVRSIALLGTDAVKKEGTA